MTVAFWWLVLQLRNQTLSLISFIFSLEHTHPCIYTYTHTLFLTLSHTQSFVVRNSQKARYALSVRLEDKLKDDLAVKHFLIQTNQQRELYNCTNMADSSWSVSSSLVSMQVS